MLLTSGRCFSRTVRGCVFKCKFCYYPKSYDALLFRLPREDRGQSPRTLCRSGVREIVLLDPTLNQRPDFADFLRLLAEHNPDRQFTFFGELRAEGIKAETARLLKQANFSEVEIGIQSLDPHAQGRMDRTVHVKSLERGAKAMLDEGIDVRVDLILGLPGDTPDSFRHSMEYLHGSKLYTAVQVFNLSILPGTAFRQEAPALGLTYQPRPPYYVLRTPDLSLENMVELMEEAQDAFDLEFDPFPPPVLEFPADERSRHTPSAVGNGTRRACEKMGTGTSRGHDSRGSTHRAAEPVPVFSQARRVPATEAVATVELDLPEAAAGLPPASRAEAFTLLLRSGDFDAGRPAAAMIRRIVEENPHTTLQVVLEPTAAPERLTELRWRHSGNRVSRLPVISTASTAFTRTGS